MQKCPMCGYSEIVDNKPRSSIMNHYVNPRTKEVSIFNSPDEKIKVGPEGKAEEWVRKDVHEKAEAAKAKAAPATPATPATPTK